MKSVDCTARHVDVCMDRNGSIPTAKSVKISVHG